MSGVTPNRIRSYQAPDQLPTRVFGRQLFIPDDFTVLAAVGDVLAFLTLPGVWIPSETVTEDQMIALLAEMNYWMDVSMLGVVYPYTSADPPHGTLPCDGSTYTRADYPRLYAALDAVFIVDADHFITPDLRGRTVIGVGLGPGLSDRSMNDSGGEEEHTLIIGEMPNHAHSEVIATSTVIVGGLEDIQQSAVPSTGITGYNGGDNGHNNMQPFAALKYCVVAL